MKDIKIKITDNAYNLAIIDNAEHLGYKANKENAKYLLDADYLIIAHNQEIRWCGEDIFNSADNYEEMTESEFLLYGGEE